MKELAEELGVSGKTIRRDLDTFRQVGFPLEEIVENRGRKRWRIAPNVRQPALAFAYDEAVALFVAQQLMHPLAGSPFAEAAQRAFRKVSACLGHGAAQYVKQFATMFCQTTSGTRNYADKAELIDRLLLAIEDRRSVLITYQSLRAAEPVTYSIDPYGLIHHRGSLYLVGWLPSQEQVRHWKVDRMFDAEPTESRFQRPDQFDLQEHMAKSFGVYHGQHEVHVAVRFSSTVARYVSEKVWHSSQRLQPQSDGSLVAEFDLNSIEEFKHWILSFGAHAVVLEPEALREEVCRELEAAVANYGGAAVGRHCDEAS